MQTAATTKLCASMQPLLHITQNWRLDILCTVSQDPCGKRGLPGKIGRYKREDLIGKCVLQRTWSCHLLSSCPRGQRLRIVTRPQAVSPPLLEQRRRDQAVVVMSVPYATPESIRVSTVSQRDGAWKGQGLSWLMIAGTATCAGVATNSGRPSRAKHFRLADHPGVGT
jgi:hypothetical protein